MDTGDRSDSIRRRRGESTYQCEANESASEAVVGLVAAHHDSDPAAIDPPLYDVIDPDALDALFVDAAGQWTRPTSRVEFPYCGCQVEVRGDGRVTVREEVPEYEQ